MGSSGTGASEGAASLGNCHMEESPRMTAAAVLEYRQTGTSQNWEIDRPL